MPKISMSDVAHTAGVSIATVSHVINNTRFVSASTRKRVENTIVQLGYTPDMMGRIFKTGKKYLIGLVVPDIANPFFAHIIQAIENAISKNGYRLILSSTNENAALERENLRILSNGMVDGLIVASTLGSYAEMQTAVACALPLVLIDRTWQDCPVSPIVISNYDAIYQAVETLLAKGHRQIGFISGLPHLSTTQEQCAAYSSAMAAHNALLEENLICTSTSAQDNSAFFIEKLLKQGCTALIVCSNDMTNDVLCYLDKHNLLEKIDLVGCNEDNRNSFPARRAYSITQPAQALGQAAAQQILAQIEHHTTDVLPPLSAVFSASGNIRHAL